MRNLSNSFLLAATIATAPVEKVSAETLQAEDYNVVIQDIPIKSGDTLSEIVAKATGLKTPQDVMTGVKYIAEMNHIPDQNKIYAGDKIELKYRNPLEKHNSEGEFCAAIDNLKGQTPEQKKVTDNLCDRTNYQLRAVDILLSDASAPAVSTPLKQVAAISYPPFKIG